MVKRSVIIATILCFANSCFGATIGNTSDPKIPYGPGIANMETSELGPFKVGFDYDWVVEKDLEGDTGISSAEIEGQWYLLRIGYTFADRVEPYLKLGMSHLKTSWTESVVLKAKAEDAFTFGLGTKVLAFEIPEYRIRTAIDWQFLYTDPDVDKGYVSGVDRTVSATEFKVMEWQLAGIVSMEFPLNYDRKNPAAIYSIIPYLGFAYFDSDVETKFTYSGTAYSLSSASNDSKVLFITGVNVTSPENVTLNAEGRFVGETAASGGLTLKF